MLTPRFGFARTLPLLLCLLFAPATWRTVAAEALIVGIGDGQAPPFVIRDADNRVTGGIIKELMDRFGTHLNIDVQYLSVPRKRMEAALLSGQIHVVPLSNPIWFRYADQYRWSTPVLKDEDIFLQNAAGFFQLRKFSDLSGKRLGTVRGYHYEGLMDLFEDGSVVRDDGTNLEQNLERLASGRIDALIGSKLQIEYLLSQHPAPDRFRQGEMAASIHYRRAAFFPDPPLNIDEAYTVLQQMRLEGEVEAILERYR